MRYTILSILAFVGLALSAAINEDWGVTLDDFAPNAPWKRSKLPHLDTFADQEAFEADVDGEEALDLSLNPRSPAEVFGLEARAAAATCACPAGYKSCCPKWNRCFKPAPEKINCCKIKTGTVACEKPKSCCYNGCCKSGYKCCRTNGGVFFCGKGGCD